MGCTSNSKGPVDPPKTVFQVCASDAIRSLSPVSMSISFPPYLCKNTSISLGKEAQGVSSVCLSGFCQKYGAKLYTLTTCKCVAPNLTWTTSLASDEKHSAWILSQAAKSYRTAKRIQAQKQWKNCPSANQLSRATPHTGSYPLTNKHANDF